MVALISTAAPTEEEEDEEKNIFYSNSEGYI
jgi:hypothetical protein